MTLTPHAVDPRFRIAVRSTPSLRVLVVEDDDEYAALLRRTLSSAPWNHRAEHCARLGSALLKVERERYDAMLLDLSLPDGAGLFTIGCACMLAEQLPILVLTSSEDESMALRAVQAGAQDYLVKDRVDRWLIPNLIRRAVARHRRLTELLEMNRRSTMRREHLGALSLRDPVTGLPTELLLCDRLSQAIASQHGRIAVLILALDELDELGDLCGASTAEEMLRIAALRLGGRLRPSDTLAVIGSSRFAVVLDGVRSTSEAGRIARSLLEALGRVRTIDPTGLEIEASGVSVGIALHPEDGSDCDTLLENAELAMNEASRNPEDPVRFYGDADQY